MIFYFVLYFEIGQVGPNDLLTKLENNIKALKKITLIKLFAQAHFLFLPSNIRGSLFFCKIICRFPLQEFFAVSRRAKLI